MKSAKKESWPGCLSRVELKPSRDLTLGTMNLVVWGFAMGEPEPTIQQDAKFEVVLQNAQGGIIAREKITIYQDSFAVFEKFEARFFGLSENPETVTLLPF